MRPSTDGIFALLRGLFALLATILGIFAALLRMHGAGPHQVGSTVEHGSNSVHDTSNDGDGPLVAISRKDGLCCETHSTPSPLADFVVEEFDVARDGSWLLVPVSIDGKEYPFIIDTGFPMCVVDHTLQPYLKKTGRTIHGGINKGYEYYRISNAHLGVSRLPVKGDAICGDLSRLRKATGCKFYGILGMTFLTSFVIHINFEAGKLSIMKSGSESQVGEIALSGGRHRPTLAAEIWPGKLSHFLIDTGMATETIQLETSIFTSLSHEGRLDIVADATMFATFYGQTKGRVATIDRVRVAGFENTSLSVTDGPENMLGLGFLSQFDVTFDFPRNVIYLKRAECDTDSSQFDLSGLWPARVGNTTVVQDVREESPAQKAGLQAGDCILRVDEINAGEFPLLAINGLLSKEGRPLRIAVERNGVPREFELQLADWQTTDVARRYRPVFERERLAKRRRDDRVKTAGAESETDRQTEGSTSRPDPLE